MIVDRELKRDHIFTGAISDTRALRAHMVITPKRGFRIVVVQALLGRGKGT